MTVKSLSSCSDLCCLCRFLTNWTVWARFLPFCGMQQTSPTPGSTFENALCVHITSDFFVTGMNFLESPSWNYIKISLISQIRMLWLKYESMWSQCLSVLKFVGYFSNNLINSAEQLVLQLSVFTFVNWNLFLSTKLSPDKNIERDGKWNLSGMWKIGSLTVWQW